MTGIFRLALLISALLSLFGQGVAMAMSPNCAAVMVMQPGNVQAAGGMQMADKMDCCPDEANGKQSSHSSKDKSSTCPMMASCLSVLAFSDLQAFSVRIPVKSSVTDWLLAAQFVGRSTAPEPPPPTI